MNTSRLKTIWLLGFIALVLLMISIGGLTRLTRSGLSIVEWKPIIGIIPPINEQDWQEQFDLYKKSPEYTHVNSHFELKDYKKIFLLEYLHRLLGRIIFLYIVIPGLILWRKKIVPGKLVLLLSSMVAVQGLVGWLMVKTGLNLKPHVSPYMLSLHFFLALLTLLVAYYHLSKVRSRLPVPTTPLMKNSLVALGVLIVIQIFYGCLTSGLKAGLYFNTYPLMDGEFFPQTALSLNPFFINFFENPVMVQWTHRWIGALTLVVLVFTSWLYMKHSRSFMKPFVHLISITLVQVVLGILTLIMSVPIHLAATHQFFAALIFLGYFNIFFRIEKSKV